METIPKLDPIAQDGPPVDPNAPVINLGQTAPDVFAVADEGTGGKPDSVPTVSSDASPSDTAPVTPDTGSIPSPDSPDGGSPNRPSTSQENSPPYRSRLGSLALTAGLALGMRKGFDLGIFADAKENLGPVTGVVEIVGISSAVAFTGLRKTVANFGVKRARSTLKKTGAAIERQKEVAELTQEEADDLAPAPKKGGKKGTKKMSEEEQAEWDQAEFTAEQEQEKLDRLEIKKQDDLQRLRNRGAYRTKIAKRQDWQSRVYDGAARRVSSVTRQALKKSRNS